MVPFVPCRSITTYLALRRRFRETGADCLPLPTEPPNFIRQFFYSEIMKYATRILAYVIAVSKSQEFLLSVCRLFIFFSTTTQGIRLRRRVDVFSDDVVH